MQCTTFSMVLDLTPYMWDVYLKINFPISNKRDFIHKFLLSFDSFTTALKSLADFCHLTLIGGGGIGPCLDFILGHFSHSFNVQPGGSFGVL